MLALLLASIGLYGVLSYNVARRTQEIGVRMALGARRIVVMRSVLGHSGRLTVMGLGIGLLGAAAGSRSLSGLLYGVTPLDPMVLALVAAVFIVVTTVAAYLPARRATRVDPLIALRSGVGQGSTGFYGVLQGSTFSGFCANLPNLDETVNLLFLLS